MEVTAQSTLPVPPKVGDAPKFQLKEEIRRILRSNPILNFNLVERDRWIRKQAELIPAGSKVLDMGAGSSPYRQYFSHCTYHTQDFAQLQPDQLRGKQGYSTLDYECDILNVPAEDGSYDVILNTEVIEHVPQPIEAVREMGRLLKPGGKLILTAPQGSGIHQEPYHFYGGYTPYWYEQFLPEAGFEDISVEPNGGFFKYYGQESIRFLKMTAPWNISKNPLIKLAAVVPWTVCFPWFFLVMPVAGTLLDRFDTKKEFTIGYHVTAIKK